MTSSFRAVQVYPLNSLKSLYSLPPSIRQSILLFHSPRISHSLLRWSSATSTAPSPPSQIIRPLVPPPSASSGPLLTRRPDRELPEIDRHSSWSLWAKTLPIFIALITVSSLAIFNYQKSSSSTVNSILYALRTNATAREMLGDEIYFASKVPWISGELNQLHGNIDISFWVKGTKGKAQTRFVSVRKTRSGFFETLEWSLKSEDGREVQLLEMKGTPDPMKQVDLA